jgi:hypothetical protein
VRDLASHHGSTIKLPVLQPSIVELGLKCIRAVLLAVFSLSLSNREQPQNVNVIVGEIADLKIGTEWIRERYKEHVAGGIIEPRFTDRHQVPFAEWIKDVAVGEHGQQFDCTGRFVRAREHKFNPPRIVVSGHGSADGRVDP